MILKILKIVVKAMLVTILLFCVSDGDQLKILVTESLCCRLFSIFNDIPEDKKIQFQGASLGENSSSSPLCTQEISFSASWREISWIFNRDGEMSTLLAEFNTKKISWSTKKFKCLMVQNFCSKNQGQAGFMTVFIEKLFSCLVRPTNSLCRHESDALFKSGDF